MSREIEIAKLRESFESSCYEIVGRLNGWGDISWNIFDYPSLSYENAYSNACWQSFLKGADPRFNFAVSETEGKL